MHILNKLFAVVAIFFFLSISANAQPGELYGLATPFEQRVERLEEEVVDMQSVLYKIDPETGVGTMIGGTGFT